MIYDRLADKWGGGFNDLHRDVDVVVKRRVGKLIEGVLAKYVILPIYLYDHGGLCLNTGGFGCRWDSGQIGFIFCDPSKEFDGNRDKAEKHLKYEVKLYSGFLAGNIYGFIVEDDNGEEADNCWGFYGHDPYDNGMEVYISKDILDAAEVVYE